MHFLKLSLEEAKEMSYKDLAYLIIVEKGAMKIADVFKKIIDKLQGSEEDFQNKIGDFYTKVSTDKRFIIIDGELDLKENHGSDKVKKALDDDDDDIDDLLEEEETLDEEDHFSKYDLQEDDDYEEDDLKDLVIIDEDEIEE